MTAQFRHKTFARAAEKPPTHQFLDTLVPITSRIDAAVLRRHLGKPGVELTVLRPGSPSLGLVAVPERTDVTHISQDVALRRHFESVGIEVTVMALVSNGEQLAGLLR